MRKYILAFLIVFCVLFININDVNAAGGYCPRDVDVKEAYSCDYHDSGIMGSLDYSLNFIKTSSGYCAELNDLSLYVDGSDWGPFQGISDAVGGNASMSYDDRKRKVTTFELEDEFDTVFNNKQCPRIKTVFTTDGFGSTSIKSLVITSAADPFLIFDGEKMACGFSSNIAYLDSFCFVSDGSNFKQVEKEDAEEFIDKANNDREGKDNTGIIDAIMKWGKSDDETKYDKDSVDPCALISGGTLDLLQKVFMFISVAGIIILVVMTAISLIKVITASEDNALSNFLKGFWKRIICLIILLLLPTIITFLIQVVNGVGVAWNINSDNPLCDVTK